VDASRLAEGALPALPGVLTMNAPDVCCLKSGDAIVYRCQQRGGYRFVVNVAAKFVRIGKSGNRVTIEVTDRHGKPKRVSVNANNIDRARG
jgi:hypothetical protein